MKIVIFKNNNRYKFTNENIEIGDEVFPLVSGWHEDSTFYISHIENYEDEFRMLALTGWPSEPHTVLKFEKEKNEPLAIITDKGYSPAECYFKQLNKSKGKINDK